MDPRRLAKLLIVEPKADGVWAPQRASISGGRLEKIIAHPGHPAREQLLWRNAWFGENPPEQIEEPTYFEFVNPPLYLHPEMVEEVIKYADVPGPLVRAYRELAAHNVSRHADE